MDWLALQLCDSAFPMGGFAHSLGLEAAVQLGHVDGEQALVRFLEDSLVNARHQTLPWVQRGATAVDAAALAVIDRACDPYFSNPVAARASSNAGRAFVIAARAAFGTVADVQPPLGHLAPVSGYVMAQIGLDAKQRIAVHLFWTMRSILSAAVRLGRIGPLAAQRLQVTFAPLLDREQHLALAHDLLPASTAPLLDLMQMTQDQLYSRLFQS